jgi:predicted phosphoribosyltransferase
MFKNRKDAGQQLAEALDPQYRADGGPQDVLVLAIPRGGVEVGYQVAKRLNADFSLLVTRKLPFPHNPESGFGALAEGADDNVFIFDHAAQGLSGRTIDRIVAAQKEEIKRRVRVLRRGQPLPRIARRTVILVDDGIAMGSTMRASVNLCHNRGAGSVVVAVPVAGPRVKRAFEALVDDLVVLESPPFFRAVAQVYENWYDVSDQEVLDIMARWRAEH